MRIGQEIGTRLLLGVIFVVLQSATAQTDNCDISWFPPLQISTDSVPSNVPHLAVEGDTIHLIWLNTDNDGITSNDGVQYSHSYNGGLTFSPQRKLLGFDSTSSSGVFIASQGSFVYAVFVASVDTFYGTAFMRSTDAGTTWEPMVYLLKISRPLLTVSQGDRVYIHYLNQATGRYGMMRSDDNGATWNIATSVMSPMVSMVAGPWTLSAVGTASGLTSKEVVYYYSIDLGVSWYGSEILSKEDPTPSTLPSIAMNENGDLFAAWNDTGTIVLRRSWYNEEEGLLWRPQVLLSDTKGAVFSDIAAGGPFVSVVWDNDVSGSGSIRIRPSNDLAATFCPVDFPSAAQLAGGPTVKIEGNKLHLVWSEVINGSTEIIYRQGLLKERVIPSAFRLQQNYPNPFNGSTIISYDLHAPTNVLLTVYNLLGQRVATLVDGFQAADHYNVPFEGTNLSTGVYFYRLQSNLFTETKKMLLIR